MGKRLTTEEFIERARKTHNNLYDYSQSVYKNSRTKIKIICKLHGVFFQFPFDHFSCGCSLCAHQVIAKKLAFSKDQFIEKANLIHNHKYDYSKVEYINSCKKIEIICKKHGSFFQSPKSHTIAKQGCAKCANCAPRTFLETVEKAKKIHNNKFKYIESEDTFKSKKLLIECNIHGKFEQFIDNHLSGAGCPSCYGNKKYTTEEFINKSSKIHNNKYDYSKTKYINNSTFVDIICKVHGLFSQKAEIHLKGNGCPSCGGTKKLTQDQFIEKANLIHNHKYDYSKSIYLNRKTKIIIICKNHGQFLQSPADHLGGHGCKSCNSNVSKQETKWLDSLNIQHLERQKTLKINNKRIIVDGFDEKTNTVYEFYGDFWHGNPSEYNLTDINKLSKKTFGELYKKTIEKECLIKSKFNLITIWESDWIKKSK